MRIVLTDYLHPRASALAGLAFLIALPMICPTFTQAQAAHVARAVTLQDALQAALNANPDVIAARLRTDSVHAERTIATSLPNPMYTTIPANPYQYTLGTALDVGPQRLYRVRASARGEAAAGLDSRDVVRQVTFQVRQAFFDVLLADSLRDTALQQRDIVRQILLADSVRLRSGEIAERNVVKSELELARAEASLTSAEIGTRTTRIALQALLGNPRPDANIALRGELRYQPHSIPSDSLYRTALLNRADVAAAAERTHQSESLRSLTRASLIPLPILNLVYQPEQPLPGGSHYGIGLSFSLPVWNWYRGERQRASGAVSLNRIAESKLATQVASEVAIAEASFHATQQLASRYEGVLAKAAVSLEASRYAYAIGAGSLLDLLDSIRGYGQIRSDYMTSLHDYWISAFALNRAVGIDVVPLQ